MNTTASITTDHDLAMKAGDMAALVNCRGR
jgi:hypothetical protein